MQISMEYVDGNPTSTLVAAADDDLTNMSQSSNTKSGGSVMKWYTILQCIIG